MFENPISAIARWQRVRILVREAGAQLLVQDMHNIGTCTLSIFCFVVFLFFALIWGRLKLTKQRGNEILLVKKKEQKRESMMNIPYYRFESLWSLAYA